MSSSSGWEYTKLDPAIHDRNSFSCGESSLDDFIRTKANKEAKQGYSGCFVAINKDNIIGGYYTLSHLSIDTSGLPDTIRKKLPRYGVTPAFLLGRLAVDIKFQGQHLGADLLVDALKRAYSNEIPAYAVVVDALNTKAENFYVHMGFSGLRSAPGRFFMPMRTIERVIQETEEQSEPE